MEPGRIHFFRLRLLPARWWCLVLFVGGINSTGGAPDAPAAPKPYLSPRVWKAGFLQKVLPYVTWRPDSLPAGNGPMTIGLLGHDPFDGRLSGLLAGSPIAGRSLSVVVVTNLTDIPRCQALFVPAEEQERWKQWRQNPVAAAAPVLTIGDSPGFLASGGIIQLEPREQVFYMNLSHSKSSRLQLTRLVKLARKVFMDPGTGPDNPRAGD